MDTSFTGRERGSAPAHSVSLQNGERSSFASRPGMHRRIPGSRFRQIAHQPVKYTLSQELVLAMLISISQLAGLDV